MYSNKIFPIFISVILGVVYFLLLAIAWAHIPNFNPITQWLLDNLAATSWYRSLVFIHDLLLNIILGFPLAALIYYLRPKNYILYLALALLPSFIWTHSVWINNPIFSESWPSIILGWPNELFCVPIALMIICWSSGKRT
jgi:hypothetical protein